MESPVGANGSLGTIPVTSSVVKGPNGGTGVRVGARDSEFHQSRGQLPVGPERERLQRGQDLDADMVGASFEVQA